MDHLWNGGGARGEFPDFPGRPTLESPQAPERLLRRPLPQHARGTAVAGLPAGLRPAGRLGRRRGFNWGAQGFGAAYKQALLQGVTTMNMGGMGECLPRADNFVEIDPGVVDAFGIPVLRIHMSWGDNERAMIPDMANTAAEMLEAAGAKNIQPWTVPDRMPGMGIHEVGVARMGNDPTTSVLNQFQQSHDVRNLFVMDGSCFPSIACQNPTLTIMALAVRSCDYLLGEMKRGNL
jgi:choline dehydrogenase-like flavoprotein